MKYDDYKNEGLGSDEIEQRYIKMRNDFERLHGVVQDLADALDNPIPSFEIEEDKSKMT